MTLDDVKLSRRNFLKLVGAVAAGTAVGWRPEVQMPPHTTEVLRDLPQRRQVWNLGNTDWASYGDGVLSAQFVAPYDARGDADLSLWWTGPDCELGWWVDALEVHEDRTGNERLNVMSVLPESLGTFRSAGADLVSRDDLGTFALVPGWCYAIGLKTLQSEWRWEQREFVAGWTTEDNRPMILGLNIEYEA